MKTLRPICLLLAGVSLLFGLASGMILYATHVGEPTVQYRQAAPQDVSKRMSEAPDIATVRNLCLPLVQVYNSQSNTVRELAGLWHNSLMAALGWAALSAVMFLWVFGVLYKTDEQTHVPA